jgi:hypothetical protein
MTMEIEPLLDACAVKRRFIEKETNTSQISLNLSKKVAWCAFAMISKELEVAYQSSICTCDRSFSI